MGRIVRIYRVGDPVARTRPFEENVIELRIGEVIMVLAAALWVEVKDPFGTWTEVWPKHEARHVPKTRRKKNA